MLFVQATDMFSLNATNLKSLEKITLQLLQVSRSVTCGIQKDEQLTIETRLQQLEEQFRIAIATQDTFKALATAREISALGRELLGYLHMGKDRDSARRVST